MKVGELDVCSEVDIGKLRRNQLHQPWVILARGRGVVAKELKTQLELKTI